MPTPQDISTELNAIKQRFRSGQSAAASDAMQSLLTQAGQDLGVQQAGLGLYMALGDLPRALACAKAAQALAPQDAAVAFELAQTLRAARQDTEALAALEQTVALDGAHHEAWLMLGYWRQESGSALGAAKAWYQGINRAQAVGKWQSEESTHPSILPHLMPAMAQLKTLRREHLQNAFAGVRSSCGAGEVARIDRALLAYLGETAVELGDPRQKPKVINVPGLQSPPFHDPYTQPWAQTLVGAWQEIRAEAVAAVEASRAIESFLTFKPGDDVGQYVSGAGLNPAWDALFFYRHGKRYDANHAACPTTSALLDGIELCRIEGQAPEVCFSVLRPGTTIERHYGVTNARLVFHLPLVVPPGCALNLVEAGSHEWQDGQPMMFDDTYLHEAWNRSSQTRIVLLMDCWNPQLSAPERLAFKALIEAITAFEAT